MDNLKIVYKILKGIDLQMDSDSFDNTFLEVLKISEERKNKIIQSMIDDGLISGFTRIEYLGGYGFKANDPRLTLKGMEYLSENSIMQKIKNGLKDVKELTPFI